MKNDLGRYLVFNIGCIECGVSSDIVGFYDDKDRAEMVAKFLGERLDWREGGQNSFEVFDTRAEQASEYKEALRALAAQTGGE